MELDDILGSHRDGYGYHTNMLAGHMDGTGGHSSML